MVKKNVKLWDHEFPYRFYAVENSAVRSNIFGLLYVSYRKEKKKKLYAFQTHQKLPLCDAVTLKDHKEVKQKTGNLTLFGKQNS